MDQSIHAPKRTHGAAAQQYQWYDRDEQPFEPAGVWKPLKPSKAWPSFPSNVSESSKSSSTSRTSRISTARAEASFKPSVSTNSLEMSQPFSPIKPSVIHYSAGELRYIGGLCGRIPLSAASIDAMINYELRCEKESHSLFKADEFHYWQRNWGTEREHQPQYEEPREAAVKYLKLEMRCRQQALALDRLEDRLADLERQRAQSVVTSQPNQSEKVLQTSAGDSDCRKAAFEASVGDKLLEMPLSSRHRATVNVVFEELDTMKATSGNLEKLLDALTRQNQDTAEVLPRSVNGFKGVGGLARWALPHVQQLEHGIRELAYGESAVKRKTENVPIKEVKPAHASDSEKHDHHAGFDNINAATSDPFAPTEAPKHVHTSVKPAFYDKTNEADSSLSIPGSWGVFPQTAGVDW